MKIKTKKKGFTLIELLVCLFIIGLMMLLIIPNIDKQRENAQNKADDAIVKVIKTQQEAYMFDKNTKEVPDAQKLKDEGFIDDNQLKAYISISKIIFPFSTLIIFSFSSMSSIIILFSKLSTKLSITK